MASGARADRWRNVRFPNSDRKAYSRSVPRSRHPVLHFRGSVWTYPASLKYLAPKFLLYSEKSTKLFGRSTDDRSERFCLEFRANLRVRKDLIHHTVELLNYGDRSSGWRHEAERFGGLEVDEQLNFCGLLDRQVSRLFALEEPGGVDANPTE